MYKRTISRLKVGSPQYVVAHGTRQRQRGRNPALPFRTIRDPRRAFTRATRIMDDARAYSNEWEYEKFMSDLPFPNEFDTEAETVRVVLAATRGDRSSYPNLDEGLNTIAKSYGIEPPDVYQGVMRLGTSGRFSGGVKIT